MGLLFGVPYQTKNLINLKNAQKKVMRVLFGDRGKFLDKFRTCIRARPYPEFYVEEHSTVNHFLIKI